jgi:MFS family permease
MWVGACMSSIGTWMQIVAQGWLIYRLSHSAFLLALDQFLGGIPIFLFTLIGGVVADRAERRKILLVSQYVQMASATLLTVLVATGVIHVWHILCLSFVSGLAQAFGGPAYQALIPTLVKREDMPNAIALNSIQNNMAVIIGPALAGQALAKLGEKWCFGLNALSFLAPIVSLSIITARFPAGDYHRVDLQQPEAGYQVRSPAELHGGAHRAGVLHDRFEHAHADLFSGVCERHLSSRSGNLRQPAFTDGSRFDLRFADGCGKRATYGIRGGSPSPCSSAWAPGFPGFRFRDRCR